MVGRFVGEDDCMEIERPVHAPLSKRQRFCQMSQEGSATSSATTTSNNSRDCYDEVLRGCYFSHRIRDSWLTAIGQNDSGTQRDSSICMDDEQPASQSIASLNRQLLQVKRRLWPAAEECSRVCAYATPQVEFQEARRNCNPLEPLGEGRKGGLNKMFMNRSAVKLANIDALLDFSLCNIPATGQSSTFMSTDMTSNPFLFVDLCGAPGGFSEYLMKRCQTTRATLSCRGYGMSLHGTNEHGDGTKWKLHDNSVSGTHSGFHTNYRICEGYDGTGDLYLWENVLSLRDQIQADLLQAGIPFQKPAVHLVVADGGFDAQRDSECQEQLAQKLVVCQVAAGLLLLQPGGTLIVKMFGFQTDVVRTVMRNLNEKFDRLAVLKPISSRPASSERYVVCHGYHGVPSDWDGNKWRDKMFLGDGWNFQASTENRDPRLENYLDEVDRDMLNLNLKSCFAILSCLERKTRAVASGNYDETYWCPERPPVNVDMYKYAWRLN